MSKAYGPPECPDLRQRESPGRQELRAWVGFKLLASPENYERINRPNSSFLFKNHAVLTAIQRFVYMQSTLTLRGVSFEWPDGRSQFDNLNLTLGDGVTGLVGTNGSGKSTLAKLLTGELTQTTGQIISDGRFVLFPQSEIPPASTVGDYLGEASGYGKHHAWLHSIDRTQSCVTLSGGEWMRVRLSRALSARHLILDEPTNNLDRAARRSVLEFIQARRGTTLVISHDRELLSICGDIVELSAHGLKRSGGGWAAYLREKERERVRLEKSLVSARSERQTAAEVRSEAREANVKRSKRGRLAAAKGGLSKLSRGRRKRAAQVTSGKMDVATNERLAAGVTEIKQALKSLKTEFAMYANFGGKSIGARQLIARARDFNIRHKGWLYPVDLNFEWRGNLRLRLKGANGAGKSVLLKALLGQPFDVQGELQMGSLRIFVLDQGCSSLNPEESVFDNIRDVSDLSDAEIRNGLAAFLLPHELIYRKVSGLSGGERLRVAIAKEATRERPPELLILDEPTNDLDLVNVEFLEKTIAAFPGPVIVISHDEEFIKNCGLTSELELGRR